MYASTRTSPHAKLRSLPLDAVVGGFWRRVRDVNHRVTLRDGYRKLRQNGNFDNLALAEAPHQPLDAAETPGTPLSLTAIPYYAWANRGPAAMHVWIPPASAGQRETQR